MPHDPAPAEAQEESIYNLVRTQQETGTQATRYRSKVTPVPLSRRWLMLPTGARADSLYGPAA